MRCVVCFRFVYSVYSGVISRLRLISRVVCRIKVMGIYISCQEIVVLEKIVNIVSMGSEYRNFIFLFSMIWFIQIDWGIEVEWMSLELWLKVFVRLDIEELNYIYGRRVVIRKMMQGCFLMVCLKICVKMNQQIRFISSGLRIDYRQLSQFVVYCIWRLWEDSSYREWRYCCVELGVLIDVVFIWFFLELIWLWVR